MRIVIVKLSALGDIVHAMIVLQFIKKYDPEILIDWVVEESYKDLLEGHPHINQIHKVNLKKAKKQKSIKLFLSELKRIKHFGKYDLVVDMQGLLKSALISNIIESDATLGYDFFSIREKFASFLYNKKFRCSYKKNIIERNIELINYGLGSKFFTNQLHEKTPFLFSENKEQIEFLSTKKKNIVLVPGASNSSKQLSVNRLAKLSKMIDANFLIIWGNEKEKELALEIKFLCNKVVICKKMSIDALISIISMVDLVIGPDTGPTHMAWALNIPSITLFGSTPGYRNAYVTNINKILESESEVNPYKINKKDLSIKDIHENKILELANRLLA
jgi:heptosyltransferase-1